MWLQFFWENVHFALNIIAAMAMFAIAWLYLDAFSAAKRRQDLLKVVGFVLLSLSYFLDGLYLESTLITVSLLPDNLLVILQSAANLAGISLVIAGLILEPIQPKPKASVQKT